MHLPSAKPTRCAVHRRACCRLSAPTPATATGVGILATGAGTIEVVIPKLREGCYFYFPNWLLERRKRAERDASGSAALNQSGRAGTSESASFARSPMKTRTLAEWPATSLAKSSEQETHCGTSRRSSPL